MNHIDTPTAPLEWRPEAPPASDVEDWELAQLEAEALAQPRYADLDCAGQPTDPGASALTGFAIHSITPAPVPVQDEREIVPGWKVEFQTTTGRHLEAYVIPPEGFAPDRWMDRHLAVELVQAEEVMDEVHTWAKAGKLEQMPLPAPAPLAVLSDDCDDETGFGIQAIVPREVYVSDERGYVMGWVVIFRDEDGRQRHAYVVPPAKPAPLSFAWVGQAVMEANREAIPEALYRRFLEDRLSRLPLGSAGVG